MSSRKRGVVVPKVTIESERTHEGLRREAVVALNAAKDRERTQAMCQDFSAPPSVPSAPSPDRAVMAGFPSLYPRPPETGGAGWVMRAAADAGTKHGGTLRAHASTAANVNPARHHLPHEEGGRARPFQLAAQRDLACAGSGERFHVAGLRPRSWRGRATCLPRGVKS